MEIKDITIEIRSVNLGRIGAVNLDDIDKLQFIKRYRNVGSFALALPAESNAVPLLAQPGRGIVIRGRVEDSAPSLISGVIVPANPNYGVLFSGPVTNWVKSESAGDPIGGFTFMGSDDNIHLADALAYGDPANVASAQAKAYDVRSGVAETVMRDYVAANIVSGSSLGSRAVPGVVLNPADLGRGGAVSGRARFKVLGGLLNELGVQGGVGFDMVQNGSEIWFEVYEPVDKSNTIVMNIENDQLDSTAYGFAAPSATRALVAGQGEGKDRMVVQRTTAESLAAEVDWGRKPERFKDRRDAELLADLELEGDTVVTENGHVITSLSVAPTNDSTMDYGRHWRLGDLVKVIVDDQPLVAVVSEALVMLTPDGIVTSATIGEPTGFDFESKIIANQEQASKRISNLEVNSLTTTTDVSPTGGTLALRDASGRAQFTDPVAAQDAATKASSEAAADGAQTAAESFATAADRSFTFAYDSAPYTALSTPDDFPVGITVFAFGPHSGWPTTGFATVETVRILDYRTVQRYNDKNTGDVWVRMGDNTGLWKPWYQQADTAYADAAQTAAQLFATSADGALGATAATANTLAKRDASARIKAANGVAAGDVATKGQVDAALVGTWQAIWMAVRTTTLSIPTNIATLVTWPTAYYDPLSLTVNASGYIEVPTDGYYRAFFHSSWQSNASGTYRIAYWETDRAEDSDWGLTMAPTGVTMRAPFVVGAVYLTAGTEVSISVRQNSGATLQLGASGQARLVLERMIG